MFTKLKAAPEVIETRVIKECPEAKDAVERVFAHLPWKLRRSISREQAFALFVLARPYNTTSSRILEIGTAIGFSAAILAEACPLASIITLNPDGPEVQQARQNLRPYLNVEVIQYKSEDYLDGYMGTGFDFIFVDGNHKYVERDLPWWERLRANGLMLFHDYSPPGSWRECPPVFEACNQLAVARGLHEPEIIIQDTDDVGMAGFRKQGDVVTSRRSPYHALMDARSYTSLSLSQLWHLFDLAQTIRDLPGSIVECGLGNGGSAYVLYEGAKREPNPIDRQLFGFGSPHDTVPTNAKVLWGLFTRDRIPWGNLHVYLGPFEQTFEMNMTDGVNPAVIERPTVGPVALLHLNTSLYNDTLQALTKWVPYVVSGGLILLTHFQEYPTVRDAVGDYVRQYGLHPIFWAYDNRSVVWKVET